MRISTFCEFMKRQKDTFKHNGNLGHIFLSLITLFSPLGSFALQFLSAFLIFPPAVINLIVFCSLLLFTL